MFENPTLDMFSRTHWLTVPLLWVPASLLLCWYSVSQAGATGLATFCLVAMGFVFWTFSEYWLHRVLFHWVPKTPWGEHFHFLLHGVHHQWPRDRYRLVMPPVVSITLFFFFLSVFYLLLGPVYCWSFHAGYTLGYMYYDITHYYLHHGSPQTAYGRRLKKHHMLHHFKDTTQRFGVSSKFWDHIFGTL